MPAHLLKLATAMETGAIGFDRDKTYVFDPFDLSEESILQAVTMMSAKVPFVMNVFCPLIT